jgi:hypothetical protein
VVQISPIPPRSGHLCRPLAAPFVALLHPPGSGGFPNGIVTWGLFTVAQPTTTLW